MIYPKNNIENGISVNTNELNNNRLTSKQIASIAFKAIGATLIGATISACSMYFLTGGEIFATVAWGGLGACAGAATQMPSSDNIAIQAKEQYTPNKGKYLTEDEPERRY